MAGIGRVAAAPPGVSARAAALAPGSPDGPLVIRIPLRRRRSFVAEALFLPGVGLVVVAVALPEAPDVVVQELQLADPLGALPEVALRDHQPERVAVLRLQRPALV